MSTMAVQSRPVDDSAERTVARVIAGFAGSRRCDALVEVAATYAQALRADFKGIYVREKGLLDLAALPFTVALGAGRSISRSLSANSLEKAWLHEEARYRRAIAQRLGIQHVEWSCETTSGSFEACLQRTATASDIVMLATETSGPATVVLAHGLLDLTRTARAVLLVGSAQGPLRAGSILAIDDGGPAGEEIVRLAAQIANATSQSLEVLRTAGAPGARSAHAFAGALEPRLHRARDSDGKSLRAFLQQPPPSLIVANFHADSRPDHLGLRALMQRSAGPILLVAN
jgi:hypothetical protein